LAVLLLLIDVHDPSRLNMRTDRDYRRLASILLRLANDPAPGTGNSEERCPQVGSDDEEHRVVLEGS
jgi:hypothetical protein